MTITETVVLEKLNRIEAAIESLVKEKTIKEFYSTVEVASMLGKADFTVREWCRLKRINATKKACGRGVNSEWLISHEELTRIRNQGLLPNSALC